MRNVDSTADFIFADDDLLEVRDVALVDPLRKIFETTNAENEKRFIAAHQADSLMFKTSREIETSTAAPVSDGWDERINTLEKSDATSRRKENLRTFVKSALESGESTQSLIDYATANGADQTVLGELREVCAEF